MNFTTAKSTKKSEELITKRRKTLEVLCKKEYHAVSNWIKKNHGTEDDSKDIFHDAVIILIEKIDSENLILSCELSTFFFSICKHLWFHESRRRMRLTSSESLDEDIADSLNDEYEEKIYMIFISLLDELDSRSKELFKHILAKKTHAEIALIMKFKNAQAVTDKKKYCIKKMVSILTNNSYYREQLDEISGIYRGNRL